MNLMSIAAWTPNQPGERMAAGERLAQFRGPGAAAIAHFTSEVIRQGVF